MLLMHYEDYNFASRPVAKYAASTTTASKPHRCAYLFSSCPRHTTPAPTHGAFHSLPPPNISLSLSPGTQAQFSSSSRASTSHQPSTAPFGHSSRLTEAANAAIASREQSQQAALSQYNDTPATHGSTSLSPGEPAAAADPLTRSHDPLHRSGPAAPSDSTPRPQTQVQPAAAAGHVRPPPAQSASPTAPTQADEQVSPHTRPPSPNTPSRTLDPPPLAGAAVSSTLAPGSSRHPLALSRAEYHALYAETHQQQRRRSANAPEPATFQAQQPESAEVLSQRTEVTRPRTPPLPMLSASQASVVSLSFSTIVAAAQKCPKQRKSRPR